MIDQLPEFAGARAGDPIEMYPRAENAVGGMSAVSAAPASPGPDRPPSAGARGTASQPSSSSGVLVVDDDVDVREALAEILAGRGYRVSSAPNGAEALQLLRSASNPPRVILLDLMMPVMDGYEFLDARRSDPALAAVPVVVITAGHRIDRARLGDTPLIAKPIKLPQLMSTLQQFGASGNVS
ncbi:MAG TPA: response regulator [Polyangiaceae bacterium]|nr:response regulator [Polyangiaceae bacterium]